MWIRVTGDLEPGPPGNTGRDRASVRYGTPCTPWGHLPKPVQPPGHFWARAETGELVGNPRRHFMRKECETPHRYSSKLSNQGAGAVRWCRDLLHNHAALMDDYPNESSLGVKCYFKTDRRNLKTQSEWESWCNHLIMFLVKQVNTKKPPNPWL